MLRILLWISIFIMNSGCLTYRWEAKIPKSVVEVDKVDAEPVVVNEEKTKEEKTKDIKYIDLTGDIPSYLKISQSPLRANSFWFKNNSKDIVFISYKSSVILFGGLSYRALSGETIQMNRDRDSPDSPIAPGRFASIDIYTSDEIVSSLLAKGGEGISYFLSIRRGGKSTSDIAKFTPKEALAIKIDDSISGTVESKKDLSSKTKSTETHSFTTEAGTGDRIGCYITGIFYGGWCWAIKPREEDQEKADKIAKEKLVNEKAKAEFIRRE